VQLRLLIHLFSERLIAWEITLTTQADI